MSRLDDHFREQPYWDLLNRSTSCRMVLGYDLIKAWNYGLLHSNEPSSQLLPPGRAISWSILAVLSDYSYNTKKKEAVRWYILHFTKCICFQFETKTRAKLSLVALNLLNPSRCAKAEGHASVKHEEITPSGVFFTLASSLGAPSLKLVMHFFLTEEMVDYSFNHREQWLIKPVWNLS